MATTTYPEKKKKRKEFPIEENDFSLDIVSTAIVCPKCIWFFFGNCERLWLIGNGTWVCVVQYCKSRSSDFVNHSYDHRLKWSPLGPISLCLTEVHSLSFHTKLCAFFHDLIKSLSLYINRGPQRPQIPWALRTRAILVLFNNWSKCFISRWMYSWLMNQLLYNIFNPMEIFFLEGFVCWRHERAQ